MRCGGLTLTVVIGVVMASSRLHERGQPITEQFDLVADVIDDVYRR